ncbi:MAG: hypothetical protein DI535_01570 [Citrobacter freundii]|nr:MAG: hypothetical protein DI535_01570 [Citrobacter freundii]
MEKDNSITDLIEKLRPLIDLNNLEIVDHWEADLCAIGLTKQDQTIYISTHNYQGSEVPKYDFDLEKSTGPLAHQFKVIKEGRAVSEDELLTEISNFFQRHVA